MRCRLVDVSRRVARLGEEGCVTQAHPQLRTQEGVSLKGVLCRPRSHALIAVGEEAVAGGWGCGNHSACRGV